MDINSIELSNILAGVSSIAIGGHINPDGDCVGAGMGLYLYLKEQFPQIQTDIYLEQIPKAFQIIQGTEIIQHQIPTGQQYDLFISLDCGDESRLGFAIPLFQQAKKTFCIDHHVSNQGFADQNYIVTTASSTSELVYRLLDDRKIDLPIATALYMGIVHDTGVFRYACTSPETMEIAANLLRKGVNGSEVIEQTYFGKTYAQNRILGKALLDSMLILDNRCILSTLSQSDLTLLEVDIQDLDGIVNLLNSTKEVDVAVFIYELEPQKYKVSLRSSEKVDVSAVAQYFGGGGHARAAGITMYGSSHDVINKISKQLLQQL